jgi:flagellar biosynthesis protein FlhB
MGEGGKDKTEKPTSKRLSEARGRGNVPKSRDLNTAVSCLGGSVAIYLSMESIQSHTLQLLQELWGRGFQAAAEANLNRNFFILVSSHFFQMIAPLLAVLVLIALAINLAQVKFLIAWKVLKPNFSRLNPLKGLANFCSLRSLLELGKAIIKMTLIAYVVYSVIQQQIPLFFSLMQTEVIDIARLTGLLVFRILVTVGGLMLGLSLFDVFYQRWQHQKDLMMSKQEIKEENKQSEGNPHTKSRIRTVQRSLWRQRMMAKVPKADLVITNPTHYAVALAYDKTMDAPRLLAKGKNLIAKRIIKIARKHQIPIVPNPPLARALYHQVELDRQIPLSLYRAVAKVLAYVYQQRQQRV